MDEEPQWLECAHAIIEIVPRLSRVMRKDLRIHSAGLFTEPQFRVMAHLFREGERCLSDLATHLGVSLPTMSKLVQGLEVRGLVARTEDSVDRRRIVLALTEQGRQEYAAMLHRTEEHLVDWIQGLSVVQCAEVIRALNTLDELLSGIEFAVEARVEPTTDSQQ